ncbi:hypothetical protein [Nocardioides sp. Iso805N]|uniref:hypothetical protein n=1 Tax=Nocardioides sp. Iso805N TaxID=1283287 RepID=UPI000376FB4C|nr:hypothetical protein [Nocardioides sp. Iso805N]
MGVREEKVVLSLDDQFTSKMAKVVTSTALFDKTLSELDGTSTKTNKSVGDLGSDNGGIAKSGKQARSAGADIDKYSGRLSLLTRTAAAIGPTLVPLTAGLIPAVTGLTAGLGAAAGAAGVALLAFHGVGDALKAMDAYQLDPTTQNLQKMQQAMDALGPAGAQFAKFIDGLEPQIHSLQNAAREGLFPGMEQGITALLPLLPQVQRVVSGIATEMGKLSAQAGKGLTGDASFQRFFNYLETDAAPTMDAFAKATGHVASGLASLTVDMAPLTRDFSGGLEHAAESFDKWAAGLNQTQGFRDFISYVQQSGPEVAHLLEAVATAFVAIAKAAAPIGSVTLPLLTDMVNLIAKIADSPLGPLIVTFVSINSAISLATLAVGKLAAAWGGVTAAAGTAAEAEGAAAAAAGGKGAGAAGLLGSGTGRLLATAGLASWGSQSLMGKLFHANVDANQLGSSSQVNKLGRDLSLTTTSRGWFGGLGGKIQDAFPGKDGFQVAQSNVGTADQALTSMVSNGQGDQAAAIFDKITASAKKQGAAVSEVSKQFPSYTAAVKASADANGTLATSNDSATASIRNMIAAAEQQHSQMLANFDSVTAYGQAVQAAAKQAASGAKGLNQYTAAGAANRQALSGMIAAWNAQPKSIRNNVGQYNAAKEKLAEFASKMGATKLQIADLTAAMNKPRKFVVNADIGQAMDAIAKIKAEAASVPRVLRTEYIVTQTNRINKPQVHMPGSAEGSTVPKDSGPYGDRYPYLLAPGEEVISNRYGQADRHRGLLKAINAGRLANGGTAGLIGNDFNYNVSSTSTASSSSSKTTAQADAATKKLTKSQQEAAAAAKKASGELSHLRLNLSNLQGKEFKDLRSGLHDLVGKDLRLTGDSLKDLNKASKLLTKSYTAQKSALDTAKSNRDSLASTVASGLMPTLYQSSTTSTNPFSGQSAAINTPGSINATISKATAQAREFGTLLKKVQGKGISGPALEEILTDGGIDGLRIWANASNAQAQTFQKGFTGLQKVIGQDSTAAGKAIYGKQIDRLEKVTKSMDKNLTDIKKAIALKTKIDHASRQKAADSVTKGVNGAASGGQKKRTHK